MIEMLGHFAFGAGGWCSPLPVASWPWAGMGDRRVRPLANGGFDDAGSEAPGRGRHDSRTSAGTGADVIVLYTGRGPTVADPAYRQAVERHAGRVAGRRRRADRELVRTPRARAGQCRTGTATYAVLTLRGDEQQRDATRWSGSRSGGRARAADQGRRCDAVFARSTSGSARTSPGPRRSRCRCCWCCSCSCSARSVAATLPLLSAWSRSSARSPRCACSRRSPTCRCSRSTW